MDYDSLPAIKISPEGIASFEKVLDALHGFFVKVLDVYGNQHEGLLDGLSYNDEDEGDGTYLVLAKADEDGTRTGAFQEISLIDAESIYFY